MHPVVHPVLNTVFNVYLLYLCVDYIASSTELPQPSLHYLLPLLHPQVLRILIANLKLPDKSIAFPSLLFLPHTFHLLQCRSPQKIFITGQTLDQLANEGDTFL